MTLLTPDIWYFRGLGLHERLPETLLATLKDRGRMERWGHRAKIFHEPGAAEVFLVLSGGVFVRDTPHTERVKLARGDMFGSLGAPDQILDDGGEPVRLADELLLAHDDTTLVAVERQIFDEVAAKQLGDSTSSLRRRRLRREKVELSLPIQPMLYTSPVRRFAKALLHLAERDGVIDGNKAVIDVPARTKLFAPLLGLDAKRLDNVLSQLELRGVLTQEGPRLLIPDLDALRTLATS
jgi:CRP-like cAMP-binding protein